jgi:hypothetical protein
MPVPAHFVTISCDQSKPMATISSITFTGSGFSLFFITSNIVGGDITLPYTLSLMEILTVNYLIPPIAGLGVMTINSDDTASPFIVNIDVTS